MLIYQGYSKLPIFSKLEPLIAAQARHLQSDPCVSSEDLSTTKHIVTDSSKLSKSDASVDLLNNRVMLIDGTAIMYRSYYKLLGILLNFAVCYSLYLILCYKCICLPVFFWHLSHVSSDAVIVSFSFN